MLSNGKNPGKFNFPPGLSEAEKVAWWKSRVSKLSKGASGCSPDDGPDQALLGLTPEVTTHGGDRKSEEAKAKANQGSDTTLNIGRGKDYLKARLHRDNPDIAQAFANYHDPDASIDSILERPDTADGLMEIIKAYLEHASQQGIEEYRQQFQIARIVIGWHLPDRVAAEAFVVERLPDHMNPEDFYMENQRMTKPAWAAESLFINAPMTWHHPSLNYNRQEPGTLRRLAYVAYYLQNKNPKGAIVLCQNILAKIAGTTRQNISLRLDHLTRIGWLTRKLGGLGRPNLYTCPAAISDTECGLD